MSNTTFVVAAFTVTWGAVLGYLLRLRRLARRAVAAYAAAAKGGAP